MPAKANEVLFGSNGKLKVKSQLKTAGADTEAVLKVLQPDELAEAIWDMLDLPLGDVVFVAWDKNQLVRQAKANTRGKPGSVEKVKLLQHTIQSMHHPKIQIEIGGTPMPDLEMELVFSIKVDSAVITVMEGQISDIVPGKAAVEAWLTLADQTIAKGQLAQVELGPIQPRLLERPATNPILVAQAPS